MMSGFHKNTKIYISQEQNIILSSNKKVHYKGCCMAKNSFVMEVTFKPVNEIFRHAKQLSNQLTKQSTKKDSNR